VLCGPKKKTEALAIIIGREARKVKPCVEYIRKKPTAGVNVIVFGPIFSENSEEKSGDFGRLR
jgi:hypothetical protein